MVDSIAGAHDGFVAALHLVSQADAGLEVFPVSANARAVADSVNAGDQELSIDGVEVRLASSNFRDRGGDIPSKPEVYGEILGCAPVILNKGTEDFPATAGGVAEEGLVVDGETGEPESQIGDGVKVGPQPGQNPVTILKAVSANVHLHGADGAAHLDVVLAEDHVKGIGDGEDVGTASEGREAAITQGVITAT